MDKLYLGKNIWFNYSKDPVIKMYGVVLNIESGYNLEDYTTALLTIKVEGVVDNEMYKRILFNVPYEKDGLKTWELPPFKNVKVLQDETMLEGQFLVYDADVNIFKTEFIEQLDWVDGGWF